MLLASDGQPAARGRVPAGTSDAARLLWEQMVGAVGADRGAREAKPRAFDLQFSGSAAGRGIQEGRVRLSTWRLARASSAAPSWRTTARRKHPDARARRGRQARLLVPQYRGSGVADGWIKLTQRDYKEDRQEVDSYAAISCNFARLIEPSCRVVALAERTVAPGSDLAARWLQFFGDAGISSHRTTSTGGARVA